MGSFANICGRVDTNRDPHDGSSEPYGSGESEKTMEQQEGDSTFRMGTGVSVVESFEKRLVLNGGLADGQRPNIGKSGSRDVLTCLDVCFQFRSGFCSPSGRTSSCG